MLAAAGWWQLRAAILHAASAHLAEALAGVEIERQSPGPFWSASWVLSGVRGATPWGKLEAMRIEAAPDIWAWLWSREVRLASLELVGAR
ncbi:MAG: hypothetical protein D6771_00215, partial [Zetaproteobacteria bacterium]